MAKRHGANYWRRHRTAWRQSELTQAAYCVSQGVNIKSFYLWRRREDASHAAGKAALTLLPVNVTAPTPSGIARLHSPGGWREATTQRRSDKARRPPGRASGCVAGSPNG